MWTSKKTFSCTLLGLLFLGTSAHANLVSQGLADSSYTASGQYLTFAPKLAFDGDFSTNWNAGAHPVNWIEVDLGQAFNLALIKLSVEQAPPGATVHDVYVSNSAMSIGNIKALLRVDTLADSVDRAC